MNGDNVVRLCLTFPRAVLQDTLEEVLGRAVNTSALLPQLWELYGHYLLEYLLGTTHGQAAAGLELFEELQLGLQLPEPHPEELAAYCTQLTRRYHSLYRAVLDALTRHHSQLQKIIGSCSPTSSMGLLVFEGGRLLTLDEDEVVVLLPP